MPSPTSSVSHSAIMNAAKDVDACPSALVALVSEDAENVDEPPELRICQPTPQKFQRTAIRRADDHPSLLTRAILAQSDDDALEGAHAVLFDPHRRRSMASNASVASTTDLTSDTGLTSPCRTNTPSPPLPDLSTLQLNPVVPEAKEPAREAAVTANDKGAPPATNAPRKRCIQFACAAKPPTAQDDKALQAAPMIRTPSAQEVPRRPCIRFASPPRPASTQTAIPRPLPERAASSPASGARPESLTPKKPSPACETVDAKLPTSGALKIKSANAKASRPMFVHANSKDLVAGGSQFHEFARGTAREEDWIRRANATPTGRLTIKDTLTKENDIRRLGAEAEEEAEQEEEDEEDDDDDDEDEDDDDSDLESYDSELDDPAARFHLQSDDEDALDVRDSEGYRTDEETGFADSDNDEAEEDENMVLWTPSRAPLHRRDRVRVLPRQPSYHGSHSDSSAAAARNDSRRLKIRRNKHRAPTPDLPDSTDFVCGTLDEDRPLEEAYLSCLAARRKDHLRVIPQDIDPSFPASDPEDEDDDDAFNPVAHDSDSDVWVQGKMEDLHHGQERARKSRKAEQSPPCRYHSPPPKRRHPLGQRARPASPRPLFNGHSPYRASSQTPKALTTPTGTPLQHAHDQFQLAERPVTTHTKSLPRQAALFPHLKKERSVRYPYTDEAAHVRGAIDIVKGLERKRQRRKEKFFQKLCNRARRGQIPERKPQPGRGAERMRELGLLMAGKKDHGNYVLSV